MPSATTTIATTTAVTAMGRPAIATAVTAMGRPAIAARPGVGVMVRVDHRREDGPHAVV